MLRASSLSCPYLTSHDCIRDTVSEGYLRQAPYADKAIADEYGQLGAGYLLTKCGRSIRIGSLASIVPCIGA